MSQIGRRPIDIPENVEVTVKSDSVLVKGKLGELVQSYNPIIKVSKVDNAIEVSRSTDLKHERELHGLYRALIANMVIGVSEGFRRELQLVGVGYTADASKGSFLLLNLGFSHPIYFEKPEGVKFETPNATTIIVTGIDKQLVGQVAAKIRELRKPEPFKGKGVRYSDEVVRRKAGKTVGVG
jgi:large subunit ribosomal protein L6